MIPHFYFPFTFTIIHLKTEEWQKETYYHEAGRSGNEAGRSENEAGRSGNEARRSGNEAM